MAHTVNYVVIPFTTGRNGKVQPGLPHHSEDRDNALIIAGRASVYASGVVVLEEEADPAIDFFSEPRLVMHFGRLPHDLLETLAA
ncbi:MAG: hypothetical protein ACLPID_06525 [Beijerinckiaceae bacterium]